MWNWTHDIAPRYGLVDWDGDHGEVWAVCTDAEGLFVDPVPPEREHFTLLGCRPAGALADASTLEGAVVQVREVEGRPLSPPREWYFYDAVVTSRRPDPASPSTVDIRLEAVVDPREPAHLADRPPAGTVIRLLTFDDEPLGTCAGLDGFFRDHLPRPARPLRFIGCELRGALRERVGYGLPVRVGWAALTVLDRTGRAHEDVAHLDVHVVAVQPSPVAAGLVDLVLSDGPDDAPSLAAEPIWDMWYAGGPSTTGLWAGLDTAAREEWIHAARLHRRHRPDDEPGRAYELDGTHVTDAPGFFCAIGEAINGPGGYFGWGWAALRDCLTGRWGARPPFTLIWREAHVARACLTPRPRVLGVQPPTFDDIVELLESRNVTLVFR